jgi:GGDEF domain-containing protein
VLEVFCERVNKLIAPVSFIARIGGEEFCLLQDKSDISDISDSTIEIQHILESIK